MFVILVSYFRYSPHLFTSNENVQALLSGFSDYMERMKQGEMGDLVQFWASYLEMSEVLLGLIRACRESNLDLLLYCGRSPMIFQRGRSSPPTSHVTPKFCLAQQHVHDDPCFYLFF